MRYLSLQDCLGLTKPDRLYYTHYVSIRDGMSASDEADLSNLAVAFMSSGGGVVGANDYLVQQQATPNNTVLIGTGRAYVPNSASPVTMVYSTYMDATQNVTIAANSSGNPRIDSVVLYINLSASPDAGADNVAEFYDVQGTPGSSPSAPTNSEILTAIGSGNPYIILANIAVANAFTSITSANITDERTFSSLGVPTRLFDSNGFAAVKTGATASAVNQVTVTDAATGTAPVVQASGTDTNIDLALKGLGTGVTTGTVRRQGGSSTDWSVVGTTNYIEQTAFMQCGSVSTPATGIAYTVTFPVAFSETPMIFLATYDSGSGYNYTSVVRSPSTTGCTILAGNTTTNGITFWLAIGKR